MNKKLEPFPSPGRASVSKPDVFDPRADGIAPEDLREMAKRVIGSCGPVKGAPVKIPRAQIRVSTVRTRVVNSNGVDTGTEGTVVYGHLTSMCVREHPGEGISFIHGTHLDQDLEAVGADLARKAYDAAGCREYKGHAELPMALPPMEGSHMLLSSMGSASHGEAAKYGRSHWLKSVDEQVASESFCVVDDPSSSGPLASVFDDEGTPTRRKEVVSKGVFKGFLRNSFCGDSTGNGLRRSSGETMGTFGRIPSVKPLNFVVERGKTSFEDMVREMDDVIVVDKFASPSADGMTGRFGLNVRCGTVYHRGEAVGVFNNALLMGNMFDCLKDIRCICSDSSQTGLMNLPTICYGGTELVGNRSDLVLGVLAARELHLHRGVDLLQPGTVGGGCRTHPPEDAGVLHGAEELHRHGGFGVAVLVEEVAVQGVRVVEPVDDPRGLLLRQGVGLREDVQHGDPHAELHQGREGQRRHEPVGAAVEGRVGEIHQHAPVPPQRGDGGAGALPEREQLQLTRRVDQHVLGGVLSQDIGDPVHVDGHQVRRHDLGAVGTETVLLHDLLKGHPFADVDIGVVGEPVGAGIEVDDRLLYAAVPEPVAESAHEGALSAAGGTDEEYEMHWDRTVIRIRRYNLPPALAGTSFVIKYLLDGLNIHKNGIRGDPRLTGGQTIIDMEKNRMILIAILAAAIVIVAAAAVVLSGHGGSEKECTVTFDANGETFGKAPGPQTLHPGDPVISPGAVLNKDGTKAVDGWYTDRRCTEEWDFADDRVTGDLTLYAHWDYADCTVTLVSDPEGAVTFRYSINSGTPTDYRGPITLSIKDELTAIAVIGRGYVFDGWDDGTAEPSRTAEVTGTATWTAAASESGIITYHFDTADTVPSYQQEFRPGAETHLMPLGFDTPSGKTFGWWTADPAACGFAYYDTESTVIDAPASFDLYAVWTVSEKLGSGNTAYLYEP